MKLVCVTPFGHLKPGDEVEVPDGAGFDSTYFAAVPAKAPAAKSTSNDESKARESK